MLPAASKYVHKLIKRRYGMKNNFYKPHLRILSALLVLALTLTVLFSCTEPRVYTKDEINSNISSIDTSVSRYEYVYLYLQDVGIPTFDTTKFLWAEMVFNRNFNLDSGLPATSEHARLTAEAFMSEYYDVIDLTDKSAVTDALITCYTEAIGDPYSIYRVPEDSSDYTSDMSGKFGGIGVVIEYDHSAETLTVSSIFIDSPADKAGFMVGDIIWAVDGELVSELGYLNAVYYVRGEIGTDVTVTVKRGEQLLDLVATRAEVEEKTVDYILEDGYGYIQITSFKDNTDKQFIEAIDYMEANGAKGIIFDLRGNPGGYLHTVCNMLSYLLPTGKKLVSYTYKGEQTQYNNAADDPHPTMKNEDGEVVKVDHTLTLPFVVICDEYTASAGEIFTSVIRDYKAERLLNATIVGKTTYGKGIMQSSVQYYDGSTITLTVAYYNPPSEINYHGVGVTPDVTVENEIGTDEDGKQYLIDNQLSTAYDELEKLVNAN